MCGPVGLCHSHSRPHQKAPGTVPSSGPTSASTRLGGPNSLKPQDPYEVGAVPIPISLRGNWDSDWGEQNQESNSAELCPSSHATWPCPPCKCL